MMVVRVAEAKWVRKMMDQTVGTAKMVTKTGWGDLGSCLLKM